MEQYLKKFINEITDRYKLMCSIDEHEKHQPSSVDYGIRGGGNASTSNVTKKNLVR